MKKMREKLRKQRSIRLVERLTNPFLVVRRFTALSIVVFAFSFFTPLTHANSDLGKLLLVLLGTIILVLSLALIIEYGIKIFRLQRVRSNRYSAALAVNTLLGLFAPLMYGNIVLMNIMKALGSMSDYGTIWCQMRYSLVNFYNWNHVYFKVNELAWIILLSVVVIFLFGGFIENLVLRKK
jgi:hypothetical protein